MRRRRERGAQAHAASAAEEARLLFGQAADLVNAGRIEDGLATFAQVRERFGGHPDVTVRAWGANARVTRGVVLGNEGRFDAAIDELHLAAEELGADAEPAVRAHGAAALFNEGLALAHAGRTEEALACLHDVLSRFGAETDPVIAGEVAGALASRANLLAEAQRVADAGQAVDELVARFGADDASPGLRERVASALATKAAVVMLRDPGEARVVLSDLTDRYAADAEIDVRSWVATAWDSHGQLLSRLGRTDEAIAAFEEVERVFGDDDEMKVPVANSLYNKGIAAREAGRLDDAAVTLQAVAQRFEGETDLELRRHVVRALFNEGIVLRDNGNSTRARAAFSAVVAQFHADGDDQICDWLRRSLAELHSGGADELEERWTAVRQALGAHQSN